MRRPLCMFCLIFVVVLVICMRFVPMPIPDYGEWDGEYMELEGQVYQKENRILREEDVSVIYLKSVKILNDSLKIPQNQIENVVCYMQGGNEPFIGSYIRTEGKLRCFSQASNPGEFDMRNYYRILKLDFKLENAKITACSTEKAGLKEKLHRIKRYFGSVLESCFNEKNASVMKAMLLGDKSSLDKETKAIYQESGIIHILAISGLHISIIGMGIYKLLRKCRFSIRSAAVLAVAFIWCYGMMTGMSTSAVRAIFMFALRLAADMAGRTYDMLTALCLAAVLLLAEQPRYAKHSGFLFSFGAVAAIGLLLPALYKRKAISRKASFYKKAWEKIRQAFFSGSAVALATFPIHLSFYFQFPIYSILLNLFVIPLMTIVMYSGLLCMIIGGRLPFAVKPAAQLAAFILWVYEKSCLFFAELPFGNYIAGQPENWQIIVYIILISVLVIWQNIVPSFWKVQWIVLALLLLTFRSQNGLAVTAVDVGQGDGIYIRNSAGRHYLIDGGSSSKSDVGTYQLIPFLKSQGAGRLSAIFVTHADSDHCNGIMTLLEEAENGGIRIEKLILPDISDSSKGENYLKLETLAGEKKILILYMSRGQKLVDNKMQLSCLHPAKKYSAAQANEYSLVLELAYKGFTALFTGDVEGEGEIEMQEYRKKYLKSTGRQKSGITLLKVSHHGSAYSTKDDFLNIAAPELAIISCGERNSYGHPHKDLLERLNKINCKAYITKKTGAVTFWTDGKKLKISSFKNGS